MKKFLALAFVVGVFLVTGGNVQAAGDILPAECSTYGYDNSLEQNIDWVNDYPFGPWPDDRGVLVAYSSNYSTDGTGSRSYIGPISVNIPAGTYDIQLVSFEDHIDAAGNPTAHNIAGQDEEQWYFVATYSDGTTYTSAVTDDVPFNTNSNETNLGEIIFTDDVVSIEMLHKYHGILDEDELWHSVIPTCINYSEVVEIDPPVLSPEIQLVKLAGQAADGEVLDIQAPGEVGFTYIVNNTGDTYISDAFIMDDAGTPLDDSDDVIIDSATCPELAGPIAPTTGQVTCTFNLDVDFTPYVNIAMVIGNPTTEDGVDIESLDDVKASDDADVIYTITEEESEEEGEVLGEVDVVEPEEPEEEVVEETGSVLGATTVLADTGISIVMTVLAGLTLIAISAALLKSTKIS